MNYSILTPEFKLNNKESVNVLILSYFEIERSMYHTSVENSSLKELLSFTNEFAVNPTKAVIRKAKAKRILLTSLANN